MKDKRFLIVGGAGLIVGLFAGIGLGPTEQVQAEPAPAVTVTPAPEVRTVEVEVTPQSCLDALSNTGTVIGIMADIQEQVSPAIMAAATSDVAALEAITSQVAMLNGQTEAAMPAAVDSINACRDSAK